MKTAVHSYLTMLWQHHSKNSFMFFYRRRNVMPSSLHQTRTVIQISQLLAVLCILLYGLKIIKETLNGYVIDLLAETYQKVSLEKTAGTYFWWHLQRDWNPSQVVIVSVAFTAQQKQKSSCIWLNIINIFFYLMDQNACSWTKGVNYSCFLSVWCSYHSFLNHPSKKLQCKLKTKLNRLYGFINMPSNEKSWG